MALLQCVEQIALSVIVLFVLLRQLDDAIVSGVANDTHGVSSSLDPGHLFSEQAPVKNDPLIACHESFPRPIGQRTLGDPGHDVSSIDEIQDELPVFIEEGHLVGGDLFLNDRCTPGAPITGVPEMQGVGIIYGDPNLESVLGSHTYPDHDREHQGVLAPTRVRRSCSSARIQVSSLPDSASLKNVPKGAEYVVS